MGISVSEELVQPVLTADAIRNTLPQVCLTDDGSPKSEGSIKNILAGFNQMLKAGLLDESRLAQQMEEGFALTKKSVQQHEAIHGKKSWPSFLNDVRSAANEIINFDTSKMTFSETLTALSNKYFGGLLSKVKLSEKLEELEPSIKSVTFRNWLSGKYHPQAAESIKAINSLDIKFNANGALSCKVKQSIRDGKKEVSSPKEEVVLLPKLLKEDMDAYISFRKSGIKPNIDKSPYLNIKPTSKIENRKLKQLKILHDNTVEDITANNYMAYARLFAKFIKKEYPDKFKSLRLSALFNHDYLDDFTNYIVNRGTITTGILYFRWIKSECDKNTYASVFVSSEDEFCEGIDDWLEDLDFLKIDIKNKITKIEIDFEELDGARNVEWILDKKDPFYYVNQISEGLWREATCSVKPASETFSAMIFDILIPCPIRKKNLASLRWVGSLSDYEIRKLHKEKTSALYFNQAENNYVIYCHKSQLKNKKAKSINSIIQPLPHLTDKFNRLLLVRQNHIEKYKWETDILFPMLLMPNKPAKSRIDKDGNIINFKMSGASIGALLSSATKGIINIFFPEENVERGINPHGMRHLSASLYLKDNPDSFTALATLLMDTLETVTRIYARRDDLGNHVRIANWASRKTNGSNNA
jgi:integrase